ncbi:MAG TPA: glycoside hydrolase family 2 TIM barrel-domain containing protein [Bryobacteraceae bacterium]|nr:glycoside hydrolase family 2 TIM barrel-domain containing protein [Bryobacteraceae bacterium]
MHRRDFLKAAAVAVAARHADAATAPSSTQRHVFPMNRNWLYGGKTAAGSVERNFNDKGFDRVTLPHANVRLPWHSFDDKDYQFISIYRRHFRLPRELQSHRVFVDFAGVMTASTVYVNGQRAGEYRGGYTPFSFEITRFVDWNAENVLAVEVDSTERADIPPFGGNIDYLTFGGIYREVSLRVVPAIFIDSIFAKPVRVPAADRAVNVRFALNGSAGTNGPLKISAELREGDRVLQSVSRDIGAGGGPDFHDVTLENLPDVQLWDLERPKLYQVVARLSGSAGLLDEYSVRIGFREAQFTPQGFMLNGKHLKLRGLNHHQTYPYVGGAMPARVQRRDAEILKKELKCNIVRTSHYPQSPHFLDACDELGLLVFEEIPGWQHIGENAWQDIAVRNVGEMIRRDWNHPSIVLWGVRINESGDNHDFYTRTNDLARRLDDSRPTAGVRYIYNSELLEDVFTMNDFDFPLRPPNHPRYLNTEFVGHTYSTKRIDNVERIAEHGLRHARVHNQLGSNDQYAGGLGWCAFDYNTHGNFGSGDRICYHGVSDIFRIPKPAAGFYMSQCDPGETVILEPGFFWSSGDRSGAGGPGLVPIWSNCDRLKVYYDGKLKHELQPARDQYPHLPHPPFFSDLRGLPLSPWGDLKIEGYVGDKLAITKTYSGRGVDAQLHLDADDLELDGNGTDATRVVLRVTDEYGGPRQFATGAVALTIDGPGEIVGENPFALTGGVGAVWVKAREGSGSITLTGHHPKLGAKTITIRVRPVSSELV